MTRDGFARELLVKMLTIRIVEEVIAERYPEQEMRCPVHLCIGQEATAVGVCAALGPQDYVMSGHRSHGHFLARGGNLRAMMAELYGRATGCSRGKGGSMHLVDLRVGFLGATPIVGSTIPIAVGTALASAMRGERRVSVAFFGEGATEEGVFHEALNFAALKRLPVLFACENNGFSVYSSLSVRQPEGRELFHLAAGHGVATVKVDGNDVFAVYEAARAAVDRARDGGGPTFLEMTTYRWREHCGPHYDNDLGYRSEREFQEWQARCPIKRLDDELKRCGALGDGEVDAMIDTIRLDVDAAIAFARQSPYPAESEFLEDVYAD